MGDYPEDKHDAAGRVNRRKFLVGVSAIGVGGAAGCLGDGGQSPTETGTDSSTPETTAAPTPTPRRPNEPTFDPIPTDLTFEYHNGEFSSMPDFDGEPTDSGEADRITADLADGPGALRFTGTLPIGDRLAPGEYVFLTGPELVSDGRLKLYVSGNDLPLTGEAKPLYLRNGEKELVVEYYQPDSGGQISLGWRGTYGELLPPLADTDPVRRGTQEYEYELAPRGRCQGKMMQMPNSGSELSQRSIAVALPTYTNYCFDMNTCTVNYAWQGAFLDQGPLFDYGNVAGDEPGQPLGLRYGVGAVASPLRIGDPDTMPETEYQGFREEPYPAKLYYTVDGVDVTLAIQGVIGSLGLQYTVQFDAAPSESVYFLTAADDALERSANAGSWNGETLELPGGTEEFTATVINTEAGS